MNQAVAARPRVYQAEMLRDLVACIRPARPPLAPVLALTALTALAALLARPALTSLTGVAVSLGLAVVAGVMLDALTHRPCVAPRSATLTIDLRGRLGDDAAHPGVTPHAR